MARPSESRRANGRLGGSDYRALSAFRQALRKFLAFSEASAHAHGLTAQQHQAILAIRAWRGPEAMSIGELADCLMIKNHSAVGLVARLQERGLVAREASQEDRRRVLLRLTPGGEQVLEAISHANLAELRGEAEALRELLAAIQSIEERAPKGRAARKSAPAPIDR